MLKIHSFLQRALKPVKVILPVAGKNKAGIAAVVLYAAVASFLILSPDTIYEHSSLQKAPVYTSGNTEEEVNGIEEETAIEAIVRMSPVSYKKEEVVQSGLAAYGIQYLNPYIPFKQSKSLITVNNDSKTNAEEILKTEAWSALEEGLTLRAGRTVNTKTADLSLKTDNSTQMSQAIEKNIKETGIAEKKSSTSEEAVQAAAKSKVDSSSTKEKSKITELEKISKKTASNEAKKLVRKTAENTVKKTVNKIKLNDEEIGVLQRIVEAEATGENVKGKMLVANVILNRVKNKDFPDSVKDVVFQRDGHTYQFSPIKDGRYFSVRISESTKKAVGRVLEGEDYSQGALYFSARIRADKNSMSWFDRHLKFLFKYGGHEFFK